jgi:hypothetical protein
MKNQKNRNEVPIAKYGLIDGIIFDLQADLASRWKGIFPAGKIPDKIGYLLSEVRREWYMLIQRSLKNSQQ